MFIFWGWLTPSRGDILKAKWLLVDFKFDSLGRSRRDFLPPADGHEIPWNPVEGPPRTGTSVTSLYRFNSNEYRTVVFAQTVWNFFVFNSINSNLFAGDISQDRYILVSLHCVFYFAFYSSEITTAEGTADWIGDRPSVNYFTRTGIHKLN